MAYTHPSVFSSVSTHFFKTNFTEYYSKFPSAGHAPANGHALLPRSNQDIYPAHSSFPSQHLSGHPLNNFLSYPPNSYPPTSSHFEPISGHSQLPLLPDHPISDDESSALPPIEHILNQVAKPASKVAGARYSAKSKGKAKALDEYPAATRGTKRKTTSEPGEEVEAKRPRNSTRGRQSGSLNYCKEDLDILMEVAREVLPIGARGWEEVGRRFNEMAKSINRPTRPYKSLELKLKNVCLIILSHL